MEEMIGTPHLTRANGTTIAWSELGEGPPLVLLHGLGDSHRTWRRAAPQLARHYRVLMPDLPGHGLSGRPDAPYTLPWFADTIDAWMQAVGVERAHVGGHSYGGGVAQWLLLERRRRVDRLALVAPGGLGREVGIGLRLASFPVLGPMLAPPLMRAGTRTMMRAAPSLFAHPEPEEIEMFAWLNAAPMTARAFHRTVAGCIGPFGQTMQTWHRIHEIELPPMAIFWGDRDPILPVQHGHDAYARMVDASFVTYPGVGHFPHLEEPERFSDDLVRFLDDERRLPARMRWLPSRVRRRGPVRRLMAKLSSAVRRAMRWATRR